MKVMIIGAKGMLGQYLVEAFSDNQVSEYDKDNLDITKKDLVISEINKIHPDIVIKAVGYNEVDAAEDNFGFANLLNGECLNYLAEACQKNNSKLVHYSSDYVFDGQNQSGYDEISLPQPISNYGRSQYLGEQIALQWRNRGLEIFTVRLSRLFGRAASSADAKKSFVDLMLSVAKNNKTINAIDEEVSCPTYAYDLANSTKKLVLSNKPADIYHLANKNACTWYEFAKEIFKVVDNSTKVIPVDSAAFPRKAQRPAYSELLNTKLEQARTWQDALRDYLENCKI